MSKSNVSKIELYAAVLIIIILALTIVLMKTNYFSSSADMGGYFISGRVTDPTGAGVNMAAVTVSTGSQDKNFTDKRTVSSFTTNSMGNYYYNGTGGWYHIRAYAPVIKYDRERGYCTQYWGESGWNYFISRGNIVNVKMNLVKAYPKTDPLCAAKAR